ncbi:hypothetical protein J6590_065301 [Homalodisca vitripennis]|nr:hypothetical protein J6590_065301 [Homalodisca vitripennis]
MKFLTYNPTERVAAEEALKHEYFTEAPTPIDPAMFPTWPAKSELGYRKAIASPKPPSGGRDYKQLLSGSIPISTAVSTQSSKSWSPQGPVVGWKYACELASSSSKTRTWFLGDTDEGFHMGNVGERSRAAFGTGFSLKF